MVVAVGLAPVLLWRRTHPFAVVATAFGVTAVVDIVLVAADAPALDVNTMVYFLRASPTPSSGGAPGERRWRVWRSSLVAATIGARRQLDRGGRRDRRGRRPDVRLRPGLGGAFPATAPGSGGSEQVKSEERVLLARELHDTVAHHVSAIAVQAQAGRALAATSDLRRRSRRWR